MSIPRLIRYTLTTLHTIASLDNIPTELRTSILYTHWWLEPSILCMTSLQTTITQLGSATNKIRWPKSTLWTYSQVQLVNAGQALMRQRSSTSLICHNRHCSQRYRTTFITSRGSLTVLVATNADSTAKYK